MFFAGFRFYNSGILAWNPQVYNKFKEERYAPFFDLQSLVKVKPNLKVIDLGCGTGELTAKLAAQLPDATVLGIDSSAEMLEDAKAYSGGNLSFEHIGITEKISQEEKYDLIFSNAALQWLDDHNTLMENIIKRINPGGQLLVQVPASHKLFTHVSLNEIASTAPFNIHLKGYVRKQPVLDIDEYAQIMFDHGFKELVVYEKIYPHILKDEQAVFDWVSGTALLRFLERLPEELKEDFIQAFRQKLQEKYNSSPVFYPFKRIIMSAVF